LRKELIVSETALHYSAVPGRPQFPENIDDLLTYNRTPAGKRHLRQKYKDPLTGENFEEIRDQLTKRLIGVNSKSDKEPFKKDNFPPSYPDFAGKSSHKDWQFIFVFSSPGQPPTPGQFPGIKIPQRQG